MYSVAKSEQISMRLEEGSALMVILHSSSDKFSKLTKCSSNSDEVLLYRGCWYNLKHTFVLEPFMDLAEVHNYYVCKLLVREKLKTSYGLLWFQVR